MHWSPQQAEALDAAARWFRDRTSPTFYLGGYAGTGKTTLARHFGEGVGRVAYGACTGKAASVMRAAGCPGATTIHSLIYHPREKPRGELTRLKGQLGEVLRTPSTPVRKAQIDRLRYLIRAEEGRLKQPAFELGEGEGIRTADLVVLDECSMIGDRVGKDLQSFGVPILVLGDPAQLPPVRSAGYFTNRKPDAILTEVHRQARDNPIIRVATTVREGQVLPSAHEIDDHRYEIRRRGETSITKLLWFEQIIVGRNATRRSILGAARDALGYAGLYPRAGEKLVGLRNNHEIGLLNGETYLVLEDARELPGGVYLVRVEPQGGGDALALEVWDWALAGEDRADLSWRERCDAQELTYGYALTCHKAQGSQWASVVVYDESEAFRADARRWLYTAITRASERLVMIR